MVRGSSSIGRAIGFQPIGCGFKPRLPLQSADLPHHRPRMNSVTFEDFSPFTPPTNDEFYELDEVFPSYTACMTSYGKLGKFLPDFPTRRGRHFFVKQHFLSGTARRTKQAVNCLLERGLTIVLRIKLQAQN